MMTTIAILMCRMSPVCQVLAYVICKSSQWFIKIGIISLILQIRRLRHRAVTWFAQGHIGKKWQSWGFDLGLWLQICLPVRKQMIQGEKDPREPEVILLYLWIGLFVSNFAPSRWLISSVFWRWMFRERAQRQGLVLTNTCYRLGSWMKQFMYCKPFNYHKNLGR